MFIPEDKGQLRGGVYRSRGIRFAGLDHVINSAKAQPVWLAYRLDQPMGQHACSGEEIVQRHRLVRIVAAIGVAHEDHA